MEKAIHMDPSFTLDEKIKKGKEAGEKFQSDTNVDIQAKGADIATKTTLATKASDLVTSLETQLKAAMTAKKTAETNLDSSYNSGVDKANEIYPNNAEILKGLSLTMSLHNKNVAICGQTMGCSAVQSLHSGKVNAHWHSLKFAKDFKVMETTDALGTMDETKYYPANPTSFDNSKGGEITPKTLGVPTWWRVYGHNASGDGVWSDPFGGFPIH